MNVCNHRQYTRKSRIDRRELVEHLDYIDLALAFKILFFFAVIGLIVTLYIAFNIFKNLIEACGIEVFLPCRHCQEDIKYRMFFPHLKKKLGIKTQKVRCPHCKNINEYKFKEQ